MDLTTPLELPTLPTTVTVRELAKALHVGVRTVWRWERLGRLPQGHRLGGNTVRWDARELMDWFATRQVPAA